MNDRFLDKEYKLAIERLLRRETGRTMKSKTGTTYEEAEEKIRENLRELSNKILNGEMEDEIQKEIETMRREKDEGSREER